MSRPAQRTRGLSSDRGFTLIELVVTIAVSSVVVSFMALFIVMPMNAYTAQTRRASLVDASDSALRFMARDIRSALPNSVRVPTNGTGALTALELLATADGARYQDNGIPALALDFTQPDGAFSTTVPFTQLSLPWASKAYYLSIYNVGVPGADAYQMTGVITPPGTIIGITAGATPNQNLVALNPPFQFAYGSPEKRLYLVSGPVSYLCDTSAGTLTRYSGYTISSMQPVSDAALAALGATSALVAANLTACTFTYSPGTAQRNALATMSLTISQGGESVQLLNEVQVVNAP
jgi:MSHA biogenesis protein MshO